MQSIHISCIHWVMWWVRTSFAIPFNLSDSIKFQWLNHNVTDFFFCLVFFLISYVRVQNSLGNKYNMQWWCDQCTRFIHIENRFLIHSSALDALLLREFIKWKPWNASYQFSRILNASLLLCWSFLQYSPMHIAQRALSLSFCFQYVKACGFSGECIHKCLYFYVRLFNLFLQYFFFIFTFAQYSSDLMILLFICYEFLYI